MCLRIPNTQALIKNVIKEFLSLLQDEMKQLKWYYDPQRSFNRIKNNIFKLYDGKYPHPPPNNGTKFHDELK